MAPLMRNCDVMFWYMSGAGVGCKFGPLCMYGALYGAEMWTNFRVNQKSLGKCLIWLNSVNRIDFELFVSM